jgi:hypothetical protein
MLDPRSPYSRRMWHYESDRPLSVAQLIALGSLDARTAALLWLLIERHQSLIVSGPTDPTPGIGKTTTLNALLDFLPSGSTLVYTTGMYEDFTFRDAVDPATTCVLANEVSDHLRIYMWGRVARSLLTLPEDGFAIATSCHADTVEDVLDMLLRDLRLPSEAVSRLGVIINIGAVGRVWPPRRRFLTVNLTRPLVSPAANAPQTPQTASQAPSAAQRQGTVRLFSLAEWDAKTDTQTPAAAEALAEVAALLAMSPAELDTALQRRQACLEQLAAGQGTGRRAFRAAVEELQAAEQARSATRESAETKAETRAKSDPTAQSQQPHS